MQVEGGASEGEFPLVGEMAGEEGDGGQLRSGDVLLELGTQKLAGLCAADVLAALKALIATADSQFRLLTVRPGTRAS